MDDVVMNLAADTEMSTCHSGSTSFNFEELFSLQGQPQMDVSFPTKQCDFADMMVPSASSWVAAVGRFFLLCSVTQLALCLCATVTDLACVRVTDLACAARADVPARLWRWVAAHFTPRHG